MIFGCKSDALARTIANSDCLQKGDFALSSGQKSEYYVDCKKLCLKSSTLHLISRMLIEKLRPLNVQSFGGMTLGADAIVGSVLGMWQYMGDGDLSGFIIRKETNDHGMCKQIEGTLLPGKSCALIEDVTTTGATLLRAKKIVEDAGAIVRAVFTVVDRSDNVAASLFDVPFVPMVTMKQILSIK